MYSGSSWRAGSSKTTVALSVSQLRRAAEPCVPSSSPARTICDLTMDSRSFLVVEDDPAAARYLTIALEELGTTRTAVGGTDALLAMESSVPDLTILDLRLPDIDGLDLLSMVKQRWPEVPVILVTAADDVATVVEAVHRGAINYLVKPVAPSVLLWACRRALAHTAARPPVVDPRVPEIVGVSKAIVTVRHLVALAARS